jgi:hypothetical protein
VKDAAANAATQVTRTVIVRAGTGSGGGTSAGDIAVNGGLKMVISMAGLYIIMAELLLL